MAPARSDKSVRDDVLDELGWDTFVDETQIEVEVADGVVTLVGTVDSYARKLAAQEAAHAVAGVRDLVNAIDVRQSSETQPTDRALEDMARQLLTWDALVPDRDIDVSVSDGWVTLSGEVSVAAQRGEAERAVAHLVGVRGVHNEIAVHRPDLTPDDVRLKIQEALRRRATHLASHIDITVDDGAVTLSGSTQTPREKLAILGAVSHAPGIQVVCDELRVDPSR
jgi:osmotically-inducible protein OsmY